VYVSYIYIKESNAGTHGILIFIKVMAHHREMLPTPGASV